MITIVSLFMVALTVAFLCYFETPGDKITKTLYWIFVVLMFLIAAFRPVGTDKDSMNYMLMYFNPAYGADSSTVEYSFKLIVQVVKFLFNDVRGLFVVYALLSIPLRAYVLEKLSGHVLLGLLIWVCHYFIFQDMTQIRVAVSSAFFLLGIFFLTEKRRWPFMGCFVAAMFFHYSSLLMLPLVLLSNRPVGRKERYVLLGVIPCMYVLLIAGIDPILSLPIPYIQEKVEIYEKMRDMGIMDDQVNVFGLTFLMRVLVFYFVLWKYRIIVEKVPSVSILLRVYVFSLCSFLLFSGFSVFASRISEFYGVVEIALLTTLVYAFRPPVIGRTIVVLYALFTLCFDIFNNHLLNMI